MKERVVKNIRMSRRRIRRKIRRLLSSDKLSESLTTFYLTFDARSIAPREIRRSRGRERVGD